VTRIRWTKDAVSQLEAIVSHIRKDNPDAALEAVEGILERVDQLKSFPNPIGQCKTLQLDVSISSLSDTM